MPKKHSCLVSYSTHLNYLRKDVVSVKKSLLFFLILLFLFCACATAEASDTPAYSTGEQKSSVGLNPHQPFPYNLSSPTFFVYSDVEWSMEAQYTPVSGQQNTLLLEVELYDKNGNILNPTQIAQELGTARNLYFCLPYPQGHDAAMGYDYTITCVANQHTMELNPHIASEKAIVFAADENSPLGPYTLTWTNTPSPRIASWGLIMSKMDWNADSYSYTVGTGNQQVNVSRIGDHTRISGGAIADLRFVNKSIWGDDWQRDFGWHTESGTYTFENVVLHGQGDIKV